MDGILIAHNPKVAGSNPAPATKKALVSHFGGPGLRRCGGPPAAVVAAMRRASALLELSSAYVARMALDPSGLVEMTAVEQRRLVSTRQVSAMELLDAHLERIAMVNPVVNAVVALDADVGRARAEDVDDALARGDDPGPLAGLVTAHKDLTETADFPTTYGSPLYAGFRPPADSLLVARMRAAGAVAVGKTNTPEFGAGSHTFNPVYGTTLNPWDRTRSAGGSSGGAAAALACRMVAIADGGDLGGSLRNPAAWNNVVGLRTTARLIPQVAPGNPWLPLSTQGPMGRTVDDVLLLLRVMAAPDDRDPLHRSVDLPAELRPPDRPLRVAWSRDLGVAVEASQLDVLDGVKHTLADLGWDVVDAEPDLDLAGDCFRVLRAWSIANSPTGRSAEHLDRVKETVPRGDPAWRGAHGGGRRDRLRAPRHAVADRRCVLRPGFRPARLPDHPEGAVPRRVGVPDRGRRLRDDRLHRLDGVVLADHRHRLPGAVVARRLRLRRPPGRCAARRAPRWRRRPAPGRQSDRGCDRPRRTSPPGHSLSRRLRSLRRSKSVTLE